MTYSPKKQFWSDDWKIWADKTKIKKCKYSVKAKLKILHDCIQLDKYYKSRYTMDII